MLKLLSTLKGQPVIAQQLGQPIGTIGDWVFNPEKGKVEAYELAGGKDKRFISPVDILSYLDDGLVVSGSDVLQGSDDLIRAKKLIDEPCRLIGLRVVSERKKRLGTVSDALIETAGLFIAKVYVKPPLLTRLFEEALIIPREQVVSITNREVTVRQDMSSKATGIEPEVAQ